MSSLPYTLSAEDAALFQSLQASALLPSLATPASGELVKLFKQRMLEEQKKKMEPYADILEHQLEAMLVERKDSILQQLKDSKGTSFTADLFSWKTILYRESLTSMQTRVGEMSLEERMAHSQKVRSQRIAIEDNGWESKFSVEASSGYYDEDGYYQEEGTYPTYPPVKVDRIFRHSDLAMRLSLKLGPNFFPFTKWERVDAEGDDDYESGYSVYKKTLAVRYYPFGVSKQQMTKLLTVAKTQAERMARGEVVGLAARETPVGHAELNIVPPGPVPLLGEYEGMPPLVPARAAMPKVSVWEPHDVSTGRCFCGCADDE